MLNFGNPPNKNSERFKQLKSYFDYSGIANHCEVNRTYATQSGLCSYEANQSDIQQSERFRNFCPAGFSEFKRDREKASDIKQPASYG